MTIRGAGSKQTVITTTTLFNAGVFNLSSGGINNLNATITIEAMTIQGGKTNSGGGGVSIYVFGPNSMLTLSDVVIENNRSTSGGGIFHEAGVLNLYNVTIRNNQETMGGDGGGLFVMSGKIILTNVTLSGNQADLGGAIYIYDYAHAFATNTLQMTNVTIYDNQAQTSGGGLYLNFSGGMFSAPVAVTATNVTFANNRALSGSGGNIYNNAATLSLKNTLIANGLANGSPNNCAGNPLPNLTSLGYNLDSSTLSGII